MLLKFEFWFLCAQDKNPELGAQKVRELLNAVDEHIPQPERDLDKPFYLPIEHIFSIPGMITFFIPWVTVKNKLSIQNVIVIFTYAFVTSIKHISVERMMTHPNQKYYGCHSTVDPPFFTQKIVC